MKLLAVVMALLLASAVSATFGETHSAARRCQAGVPKAYLTVRFSPPYLVGTIPSEYTKLPRFFEIRYNCLRGSAFIKRVDLGVYDVLFPRLRLHGAIATVISQEGAELSVYPLSTNEYRVVIRGPRVENNVHVLRDLPFSILVY